jgi:hypothetical protein
VTMAAARCKISTSSRSLRGSRRSSASSRPSGPDGGPPWRALASRPARPAHSWTAVPGWPPRAASSQLSRSGSLSCSASASSRTVSVRGDCTRPASRFRTVRSLSSARAASCSCDRQARCRRARKRTPKEAGSAEALAGCSTVSPARRMRPGRVCGGAMAGAWRGLCTRRSRRLLCSWIFVLLASAAWSCPPGSAAGPTRRSGGRRPPTAAPAGRGCSPAVWAVAGLAQGAARLRSRASAAAGRGCCGPAARPRSWAP